MPDVTFKNPDGSASNEPLLIPSEGDAPAEEVDTSAFERVETVVKKAVKAATGQESKDDEDPSV